MQAEEEEEEAGETEGEKKDPTHYTELDPKSMKVIFVVSAYLNVKISG